MIGGTLLLMVAMGWYIVKTEPVCAAYLANCQGKGFTEEQCHFLYAERRRDDDETVAISLGAAALAVAASKR